MSLLRDQQVAIYAQMAQTKTQQSPEEAESYHQGAQFAKIEEEHFHLTQDIVAAPTKKATDKKIWRVWPDADEMLGDTLQQVLCLFMS